MSWLDDLNENRIFNYRSVSDPEIIISGKKAELEELASEGKVECEPGDKVRFIVFEEDEEFHDLFEYAGFEPVKLSVTTKVVFEKNGRKGIRITDSNGKSTVRSMTRENLLKGKGIKATGDKLDHKGNKTGKKSYEVESSLTNACKEASTKVKAQEVHKRLTGMKKTIEYQTHLSKERKKGRKK